MDFFRENRKQAAAALAEAKWISPFEPGPAPPGERPAYELRQTFEWVGDAKEATLHATAHGLYEAFLNGVRLGAQELTPGLSSYHSTLYVQTFDAAAALVQGSNELRFILSDGWFRGRAGAPRVADNFGTRTAMLAELRIRGSNNGEMCIVTDSSWESAVGSIVAADLMDGQTSDMRRIGHEQWAPVSAASDSLAHDRDRLAFSPAPPVQRMEDIQATRVTRLPSGRLIIDFGEELNGWVRLSNLGPAGTRTTLLHGEWLDSGGDLTTDHLSYAGWPDQKPLPVGQRDVVISRGVEGDVFEPRHTTHGFRYVAIDGRDDELAYSDLTAVSVRSALSQAGTFRSSSADLNALHDIAARSWRSNACDIPTDCPQRERWGYTGDFQIFAHTAAFLDDIEWFARKWLRALADDQLPSGCITNVAPNCGVGSRPFSFDGSAGWGDAATIVPWEIYQAYGDRSVLTESYPMMQRWVDYAAGIAADDRRTERALAYPVPRPHDQYLWDTGFHWGEWAEPGDEFDYSADRAIVATAYLHRSATLTARAAAVLGDADGEAKYSELATNVADAWRTEFVTQPGRLSIESQANYVRALAFDLVAPEDRAATASRLVDLIEQAGGHLGTGFLSTALLLPALADAGHTDVAYRVLTQRSSPGWFAMLDRGATTVWESWDGVDEQGEPHDSLNHYSKGAVITFLHEYVAGLRRVPEVPAYREFIVAPQPGAGLTWAQATLKTRNGPIDVRWDLNGDRFTLEVNVPPNCTAKIQMPDGSLHDRRSGTHRLLCRTVFSLGPFPAGLVPAPGSTS